MARVKQKATPNEVKAVTLDNPIEGLTNPKLLENASRIISINQTVNRLDKQAQSLMLESAYRLGQIKDGQWYLADGFKNINEFGSKVLGYKSNMISKMVAASKRLTNTVEADGIYHVSSIFAHYANEDDLLPDADFGLTQLFELASTSEDAILAGLCNNTISYDMSCAKLREFAKSLKGGTDVNNKKLTDGSKSTASAASNGSSDSATTANVADVDKSTAAANVANATSIDYKRTFKDMSNAQLLEVIKCAVAILKSRKFDVAKIAQIVKPTAKPTAKTAAKPTASAKGAKPTAKTI